MVSITDLMGIEDSQAVAQDAADKKVENDKFMAEINKTISHSKQIFDANRSILDMNTTAVDTTGQICSGAFGNSMQTLIRSHQ